MTEATDDFGDTALGHAAPSFEVHTRAPGLRAAMEALWAVEKSRTLSTSVAFAHRPSKAVPSTDDRVIRIIVCEHGRTENNGEQSLEAWSHDLPLIVRGRLVATLEEWAHVEGEAQIAKSEVEWEPRPLPFGSAPSPDGPVEWRRHDANEECGDVEDEH